MDSGDLAMEGDNVVVATNKPSRSLLLAVMQHHAVQLPRFDIVGQPNGEQCIPVDVFWSKLCDVGGVHSVRRFLASHGAA